MVGRPSFVFTEKIKKEIKHLSRCAMNLDFIAESIGTSVRTMQRHPEIMKIYNAEYTKVISKIAESLLARAAEPEADSALKIFVMKTRAKWKEDKAVDLEGFPTIYAEQKKFLAEKLEDGLSVENYEKMVNTSLKQYEKEEFDTRLREVEAKLAANDSNAVQAKEVQE